jgi:predicted transcriptional regulator of viral defense system
MDARSLSRTEAKVVLSLEADGVEEVSIDGVVARAGVSRSFARKLAHTLVRKGWLQRVGRGNYLLSPARHGPDSVADSDPLRLGARLVRPYYFGYATAAELHGFLPQAGRTYYIVSPVRSAVRVTHAAQFRLVHVRPGQLFGTERSVRRGEAIVLSDRERTVLDCLRRPALSGGLGGVVQILESAGRLDWGRIDRYLTRLRERSLALRLGFLADTLGLAGPPPRRWVERTSARPGEPYVPLGPTKEFGRTGPRDPRWHIVRNVPDSALFAEVDVR